MVFIWSGYASAEEPEAKRVLAIGGAVTEIVYALGEDDRLIGRDSTSTFPPEATNLPDVGYIRALSPEGVLSVNPDLILARENNGPPEAVDVLKSTGVTWVDVPDDFSVEGVDENIRIVAEALGVPQKGDELRRRVASEIAAVQQRLDGVRTQKTVMFVLSMRDNRIMAAGFNTAADGIIRLSGARNVIDVFEGYKPLSDEAILKAAPDVIVTMAGRGDHGADDEQVKSHPALGRTPAALNNEIIQVDGLLMLGFGPRTGLAAQQLASAIYGFES
ncbi:MAG: hemin ABC transporter substrate-binding protein [Pseudomonadota bacterium]